jgi:hypothetical protein
MKKTVNYYDFVRAFQDAGRGDQFSLTALEAIFEYIEDYEQDTGEEIELDVIAICCEWGEESPKDIAESYGILNEDEYEDESDIQDTVSEYLEHYTTAFALDNGNIVYVNF